MKREFNHIIRQAKHKFVRAKFYDGRFEAVKYVDRKLRHVANWLHGVDERLHEK